ncbi:RBBP9/YdeN family alpha/beta hydrolase [Oryzibacter oryziterrae]|uniref:RBBP9/YdeN family alpha/beta hydrolase n=1 Tax=Oryzibacter oryziterrae TaxID=2766474 RepID=UPI001F22E0AD|nr:alpha/beta fold hydrolase [Oryzibacter oryziterrae]
MSTLILPGLYGSGPDHWQRLWAREIAGAKVVEQANWDLPNFDDWLRTAAAAVEAHPGAVLVGHSLGAILAAHLLVRRPDLDIAGALLVAPADVDRHCRTPGLGGFAPLPLAPLNVRAVVVASRNDSWMAYPRAKALARMWEAELHDAGRLGHINASSGLGGWEAGKALLARVNGKGVQGGVAHRVSSSDQAFAAAF